ncbi:hypothetical protein AB0M28_21940 [Streptomyces sp. NPDC051940]|uniref:hypothetical protein n=1 Tax=Streptomyces sp. NPDC051940 TaxID=3155675 RepID=UPI0034385B05
MDEIFEILKRLQDATELTAENLGAALSAGGWEKGQEAIPTPIPRVWLKDSKRAGIEGVPPDLRLAVLMWRQSEEPSASPGGAVPQGNDAAGQLAAFARQLAESDVASDLVDLSNDVSAPGALHRAWRLHRRTLLLAVLRPADGRAVVEAVIT